MIFAVTNKKVIIERPDEEEKRENKRNKIRGDAYSGGLNQLKEGNPRRESPSEQETEDGVVAHWHLSLKGPEDGTNVSLVVLTKGDELLHYIISANSLFKMNNLSQRTSPTFLVFTNSRACL